MRSIPLKALIVLFAITAFGSSVRTQAQAAAPDQAMQQVVRRILTWYFKPAKQQRTIYIAAEGIQRSWLPAIENIEFDLVDIERARDLEKGVYFFDTAEKNRHRFSIGFGLATGICHTAGDTWQFRVRGSKVLLWKSEGSWGSGCGTSSGDAPLKIKGLKIGDISPNELPGHEFFRKGKLKGIRLGITKREDIIRIFGSTCEAPCDYNADWTLWVNYYDQETVGTTTTSGGGEKSTKTTYGARPEYYSTLRFVRLTPKQDVSFSNVVIPRRFVQNETYSIADSFSNTGQFEGAVHSTIKTFTDGYGLTYELFGEVTFHNIPVGRAFTKGDLVGIEYRIPDEYESGIFTSVIEP